MPRYWRKKMTPIYVAEVGPAGELTPEERTRFTSLTSEIRRGLISFRVVGESMKEIRESRLYRETYATWAEYLKGEWGWNKNYVDRQIIAANFANIADEVSATQGAQSLNGAHGHQIIPKLTNERVVRELVKVTRRPDKTVRELVKDAVTLASANGKITALTMKQAVDQVAPPKPKAPRTRQDAPGSIETLAEPFAAVVADLRAIGQRIKDLWPFKTSPLDDAIAQVRQWTPTELCSDCKKEKSCLNCKGRGWLGKWEVEARKKGKQ